MNIDPIRASGITPKVGKREESRAALRTPTTSASQPAFRQGPKSVARSLANGSRDLAQATGFVRAARVAVASIQEAIHELRTLADQEASDRADSSRTEELRVQSEQLYSEIATQLSGSFGGQPLFSSQALRVQVESSDLGASQPYETSFSAEARETLSRLASSQAAELPVQSSQFEDALAATQAIEQEFETAGRILDGMTGVVLQERLAAIEEARANQQEPREVEEIAEQTRASLQAEPRQASKLHLRPDPQTLLALLGSPGS